MSEKKMIILAKLNFINRSNGTYTFSISKSRNPDEFKKVAEHAEKIKEISTEGVYLPIYKKSSSNGTVYYSITGKINTRRRKTLETDKIYAFGYEILKVKGENRFKVRFNGISEYVEPEEETEIMEW